MDIRKIGGDAISVRQAAKILDVSPQAVIKMINTKRLWYVLRVDTSYILSKTEVEELKQKRI